MWIGKVFAKAFGSVGTKLDADDVDYGASKSKITPPSSSASDEATVGVGVFLHEGSGTRIRGDAKLDDMIQDYGNKWNLEKLKEILTYQNDLLSDLLQKADDDRREKLKSEKGGLARVKDQGVRALEKALRAGASSAVMVLLKAKVEAAEWWQGYADATIPGATKLVLWSSTCITFFASFNKGISSSYTAHNF